LNIESELIKSMGGRFEVVLNDRLLFSKEDLLRFPEPGEIIKLINKEISR